VDRVHRPRRPQRIPSRARQPPARRHAALRARIPRAAPQRRGALDALPRHRGARWRARHSHGGLPDRYHRVAPRPGHALARGAARVH
jgi:hypothetical protein